MMMNLENLKMMDHMVEQQSKINKKKWVALEMILNSKL